MAVRDTAAATAFTEFASARSANLFRTAYLILGGDHQLAQDLVQESLIKTYLAWPRIRDLSKAEAYARRTIVTTAISWRRRRSFHERPTDLLPETAVPDSGEAVTTHASMLAQLRSLPPRQRAAIVLRYYQDLSEAQTADVMGCSVGAVKSHVSTGLARLRQGLGQAFDETAPAEREATS
ncbi:SigE family RNA polymerase sigma factor [Nocardioides guangzhouensis]|uniref:SigE family RNA polymerase sigma factor n=1 Tax=Nocardioides guangzhouensis TaxID=2497878 RepID=A0A4Q4ZCT4_9ACTN|nr:SigE family RNA polymerase sigma factor [Nocardioides guangzhouensis]RYP85870.1 SigE family RNA polymerase sigma factor [Nocardioides guangzhouensis]